MSEAERNERASWQSSPMLCEGDSPGFLRGFKSCALVIILGTRLTQG